MFQGVFNVSDVNVAMQNTTVTSNVTDSGDSITSFEPFNTTFDNDTTYNSSISTPVAFDRNGFLRNIIVIDFRQWYMFGFEPQLYGFVGPVFAFLASVINILMITAFIKRRLFTSTHIILMTIGLSDLLTVLPPSTIWMYFYGILQYKYYLPYDWCRVWHDFCETSPSMFHTISVWATVLLAIQRIIIVAFPFKAKVWCSRKLTFVGIGASVLISVGTFCVAFFEFSYVSIPVPKENAKHEIMYACGVTVPSFIGETLLDLMHYIGIRQWVRVIVNTLIPFVILLVIEISLIIVIRVRGSQRKKMNVKSDKLRQNDRLLTKVTTWCVWLFILIEIPGMLGIIFDCIYLNFNISVVPDYVIRVMAVVINLLLIATSNINFIVFSCMSTEFREFLKALYCPFCIDKHNRMSILNKSQTTSDQRYTTNTYISNSKSNSSTADNAVNDNYGHRNSDKTSCIKTVDETIRNNNSESVVQAKTQSNTNSDKLNSVSVLTHLVFGKFRSKKYSVRNFNNRRSKEAFRNVDSAGHIKIDSSENAVTAGKESDIETLYDPVLGKYITKF